MSNTISYSKEEAYNLFYLREKGRLLELKVEELGEGIKGSISPSMTTQELHELDLGIYRAETSGLYAFPDPVVIDIPDETVADSTVPVGYSVLFAKEADGWRLFQAVKMPELEVNGVVEEGNTQAVSGGEVYNNLPDLSGFVEKEDIVDNLTTSDSEKVLSAKQGVAIVDILEEADIVELPKIIADEDDFYANDGFYLLAGGGLVVAENFVTSDYIEVRPNTRYKWNGRLSFSRVCLEYDENINVIGVIVNEDGNNTVITEQEFTTSENAKYIRVSSQKTADLMQVEELDVVINKLPTTISEVLETDTIRAVNGKAIADYTRENFELTDEIRQYLIDAGILVLPEIIADEDDFYFNDGFYLNNLDHLIPSENFVTSDYIEVRPNTRYKWNGRLSFSRVCLEYDENINVIGVIVNEDGDNTIITEQEFITSENAKYIRVSSQKTADLMQVKSLDYYYNLEENKGIKEYNSIEQAIREGGTDLRSVGSRLVKPLTDGSEKINDYQITGEKIVMHKWGKAEVVSNNEGGENMTFQDVRYDGLLLFGSNFRGTGSVGGKLFTKESDFSNPVEIYDFGAEVVIYSAKWLDNGEILVIITDENQKQSAHVSSDGGTVFNKKFDISYISPSERGRVEDGWGVSIYGKIIVVSEYGTHNISNYVWISYDYGETFKVLLDSRNDKMADGSDVIIRPDRFHIHGCNYDPYWDRVWVISADNENSSLLFTDNHRDETPEWYRVSVYSQYHGSQQTVCMGSYGDFLLFGSDAVDCGVYRISRTSKKAEDTIMDFAYDVFNEGDRPLAEASPYSRKTYVGGNVYQRDSNDPIFIIFHRHDYREDWAKPRLVATYDGVNFTDILWFGEGDIPNTNWGALVVQAPNGDLYIRDTVNSSYTIVMRYKDF